MPSYDINIPFQQYQKNVQSARDLEFIYHALCSMTTSSVPKDELLRAEFVALVSALDTYIHDIVRIILKLYYENNGAATSNPYLQNVLINNTQIVSPESLNQFIQEKHGYQTFQAPPKIQKILDSVEINNIWSYFSGILPDVEMKLALIIKRRNQIAHESDINPTNGLGEKWSIDIQTIDYARDTLNIIISTIDSIIKSSILIYNNTTT